MGTGYTFHCKLIEIPTISLLIQMHEKCCNPYNIDIACILHPLVNFQRREIMLLFNELHPLHITTLDTFASISTFYSVLRYHYIVLLIYTHIHKRTMIALLSQSTCKNYLFPFLNVKIRFASELYDTIYKEKGLTLT